MKYLFTQTYLTGYEEDSTPKTYTQEEFDAHAAAQRRAYETKEAKYKKDQQDLATELAKQKSVKGLSDDEKQSLQKRIDELESQFLTEKEKADRAAEQERTQYTSHIEDLDKERTHWRSQYQTEVVTNGIRSAAAANKAFDAEQISALLGQHVEFKDILDDDDKPTGKVKPVVKFPDVDKKGNPVTLEYTIPEAVKRMTELEKFANLFEDTMRSGVGGSKNGGRPAGKIDITKLSPEEYRKLRKENPGAISAALRG
jgi:hypothetical protein